MVFLENQRRLGRRVKHGCVVAGPCFALYSDEAAWGRWDGLVRIRSASAVGTLGPHHLGGVFLVENFVAVAAFKCLLDHGGLLSFSCCIWEPNIECFQMQYRLWRAGMPT